MITRKFESSLSWFFKFVQEQVKEKGKQKITKIGATSKKRSALCKIATKVWETLDKIQAIGFPPRTLREAKFSILIFHSIVSFEYIGLPYI